MYTLIDLIQYHTRFNFTDVPEILTKSLQELFYSFVPVVFFLLLLLLVCVRCILASTTHSLAVRLSMDPLFRENRELPRGLHCDDCRKRRHPHCCPFLPLLRDSLLEIPHSSSHLNYFQTNYTHSTT